MGFASPWFLLGMAALAVPLYLHLLRRTTTPRPFSSLLFFEPQTQSSQRYRRLRYWLLLALRLALLALIVLAFANPFVSRHVARIDAARLVLLVIDHSFSMHAGTRLEDAKREALSVLSNVRSEDRVQVIAFSSQLQVLTSPSRDFGAQRAAIAAIAADDSRGNLGELANAVRQAAEHAGTPIEAHLISDFQLSNLPANASEMALPASATLVVHPVISDAVPNWTVESVTSPEQIFGNGSGAVLTGVRATVAGFATPAAERTVSLVVNGKTLSTQRAQVPANGRVAVTFAAVPVPHGFSRCEVDIDSADALTQDDVFRFAVERSDSQPVLFVHAPADSRSPLYFSNALAAAEGPAYLLQSVSPDQAARLSLNRYAFVVIAGLASLPPRLDEELQQYVQAGGNVWVVLGPGAGHGPAPVFGANILEARGFASSPGARFARVGENDAQNWLGATSLWSGVKFYYASSVEETNSTVLLRLTDRTPLLLEKNRGEGRMLLLTSGFEGLTNDLPVQPAFVAFVAQTARHLSNRETGATLRVVDSFLDLHAGDPGGGSTSGVEVIDPQGQRPLSLTDAATTRSLRLDEAGFYQVRIASGRTELVAVNPDRRESDLRRVSDDILAGWQKHAVPPITVSAGRPAVPAPSAPGVREERIGLWWFLILLALAAALAQAWAGDRHLATRREQI